MYHSFDIDIAEKYGIAESIFLCNIAFWVKQNALNGHNYFEGKYWTYNSLAAFKGLFCYMSEWTIKKAIKNLKDNGLILTGNFNNDKFNHTNYYTLTEKGLALIKNSTERLVENQPIESENTDLSILNKHTDSTDINITDIPPIIPREVAELDSMFEQFWKAYPKKVDPKGCKKKFIKIKNLKQLFPTIMQALEIQKRSTQWNEENGRFIPNPSTWINQERWNTVNEVAEKQIAIEDAVNDKVEDFF